jgi:hypothetical protein
MVRERLESEKSKKSTAIRVELLKKVFDIFPITTLVDSEFHLYLQKAIKEDQVSH